MQNNKQSFPFRNGRSNPPQIKQAPNVSFSSGMTSQQKFHSIVQSVQLSLAGKNTEVIKGCQMHPKASQKCRKCQTIIQQAKQTSQKQQETLKNLILTSNNNQKQISQSQSSLFPKQSAFTHPLEQQIPQQIKLNSENPKYHLNQKLQSNILSSHRYKILRELKSVKQVLGELTHDQISIDAYRKGTNQDPTEFASTLYRIMELKPTKPQLLIMLRDNNVNVRALAVIYIRIALDFQQIYAFLKTVFTDNKLINAYSTVGELALKLLTQEGMDQGGIRMTRIPTRIQKAINERILQFSIANNQKQVQPIVLEPKNNINEEIQKRNIQQRSRSRQKHKKKRKSSSSSSSSISSSNSSSSSSSSSSSQNSSQQSNRKHEKKSKQINRNHQSNSKEQINKSIPKLPLLQKQKIKKDDITNSNCQKMPSASISSLKQRIHQSLMQQEQKNKKQKLLLQKYNAQQKIQVQNQQGEYEQESDSIQKYQM